MKHQSDIEAALNDAQQAVDTLARDVGALSETPAPPPAEPSPSSVGVLGPRPAPRDGAAGLPAPAAALDPRLARILKLGVPVVVRLAHRQMPLREIVKVVPGTILEFDRMVGEELDLMVNNRHIGSGVAVKVNECFGLRITRIGTPRERLSSLQQS
jgi:flagellar motor switch protein FliN/FliY